MYNLNYLALLCKNVNCIGFTTLFEVNAECFRYLNPTISLNLLQHYYIYSNQSSDDAKWKTVFKMLQPFTTPCTLTCYTLMEMLDDKGFIAFADCYRLGEYKYICLDAVLLRTVKCMTKTMGKVSLHSLQSFAGNVRMVAWLLLK